MIQSSLNHLNFFFFDRCTLATYVHKLLQRWSTLLVHRWAWRCHARHWPKQCEQAGGYILSWDTSACGGWRSWWLSIILPKLWPHFWHHRFINFSTTQPEIMRCLHVLPSSQLLQSLTHFSHRQSLNITPQCLTPTLTASTSNLNLTTTPQTGHCSHEDQTKRTIVLNLNMSTQLPQR